MTTNKTTNDEEPTMNSTDNNESSGEMMDAQTSSAQVAAQPVVDLTADESPLFAEHARMLAKMARDDEAEEELNRELDPPPKPPTPEPEPEEEEEEEELEPEDLLGGSVCVFFTQSPFSDSAPHPFIIDGRFYYTLEHYFQMQLLYSFGMFKLASEAIRIPHPGDFRRHLKAGLKQLVNEQGIFDERTLAKWKMDNGPQALRRGNRAKFEQNYQLRQLLMHTGERLLIFASPHDRLFGVGMSEAEFLAWTRKNRITIEDLLDVYTGVCARPRELGQNVLGLALMEVRADLTNASSVIVEWRRAHYAQLNRKDYNKIRRRLKSTPLTPEERAECLERQTEIDDAAKHPLGRATTSASGENAAGGSAQLKWATGSNAKPVRFDETPDKPTEEQVCALAPACGMHVQIEHMTAARRAEEEARTQREKDEKERRSRTRWEQPEAVAEPSLDDAADLVAKLQSAIVAIATGASSTTAAIETLAAAAEPSPTASVATAIPPTLTELAKDVVVEQEQPVNAVLEPVPFHLLYKPSEDENLVTPYDQRPPPAASMPAPPYAPPVVSAAPPTAADPPEAVIERYLKFVESAKDGVHVADEPAPNEHDDITMSTEMSVEAMLEAERETSPPPETESERLVREAREEVQQLANSLWSDVPLRVQKRLAKQSERAREKEEAEELAALPVTERIARVIEAEVEASRSGSRAPSVRGSRAPSETPSMRGRVASRAPSEAPPLFRPVVPSSHVGSEAPQSFRPVCRAPSVSGDGDGHVLTGANATGVTILRGERRIVVKKAGVEAENTDALSMPPPSSKPPKVVGSNKDKAATVVKGGIYDRVSMRAAEASARLAEVMAKLAALTDTHPMVNPFSVPLSESDQEQSTADAPAPETPVAEVHEVFVYKRPPGRPYAMEPGEIPPPGVVLPPPGINDPPILLPLNMRDWIPQPDVMPSRPAALPDELLPIPEPPSNVDPVAWRQKFDFAPRILPAWAIDSPLGKYPLEMRRPKCIAAPREDPTAKFDRGWRPPDNPVLTALARARRIMGEVRKRKLNEKRERLLAAQKMAEMEAMAAVTGYTEDAYGEDGAQPNSRTEQMMAAARKAAAEQVAAELAAANEEDEDEDPETADIKALASKDQRIFPFGMLATHLDLEALGFIPPPIVGNPNAQRRNKMSKREWLTQFHNPRAVIRHHANRWIRAGKLGTSGLYEEYASDEELPDDEEFRRPLNFDSDEDDDAMLPPRVSVQTQIIFVDTAQYDDYVRWYQKMHGFAPLPETLGEQRENAHLKAFYQYYRTTKSEPGAATQSRRQMVAGGIDPFTAKYAPVPGLDMEEMEKADEGYVKDDEDVAPINPHSEEGAAVLQRMSLNPSAAAYGNYWALARWRWAQWERNMTQPDAAAWSNVKQETYTSGDGATIGAAPLKYEARAGNEASMVDGAPAEKRRRRAHAPLTDIVEVTADAVREALQQQPLVVSDHREVMPPPPQPQVVTLS